MVSELDQTNVSLVSGLSHVQKLQNQKLICILATKVISVIFANFFVCHFIRSFPLKMNRFFVFSYGYAANNLSSPPFTNAKYIADTPSLDYLQFSLVKFAC